MSGAYTLKITEEQAKEMPMVDLAYEILKAANTTFYYRDLMQEITKIKGLSEEEVLQVIAQLYTEINIDGRFACVGNNVWGLKRWYPVDRSEEMGGGKYPRIINDDDEEEDDYFPEEEDAYDRDEEDYDAYDAESELLEGEEEEEDFFPDEESEEELEDLGEAEIEEEVEELAEDDEPIDEEDAADDFADEDDEDLKDDK